MLLEIIIFLIEVLSHKWILDEQITVTQKGGKKEHFSEK
jgi:hypothetical protein